MLERAGSWLTPRQTLTLLLPTAGFGAVVAWLVALWESQTLACSLSREKW